jgi:hypothetical protein
MRKVIGPPYRPRARGEPRLARVGEAHGRRARESRSLLISSSGRGRLLKNGRATRGDVFRPQELKMRLVSNVAKQRSERFLSIRQACRVSQARVQWFYLAYEASSLDAYASCCNSCSAFPSPKWARRGCPLLGFCSCRLPGCWRERVLPGAAGGFALITRLGSHSDRSDTEARWGGSPALLLGEHRSQRGGRALPVARYLGTEVFSRDG